MNDIQKKNVRDILDSSGVDLRKAPDTHFGDIKLGEQKPEDYQLLGRTISIIQEGMWTIDEPEFDYNKLKTEWAVYPGIYHTARER